MNWPLWPLLLELTETGPPGSREGVLVSANRSNAPRTVVGVMLLATAEPAVIE